MKDTSVKQPKTPPAVFLAVWSHAMAVSVAALAFFALGAMSSNILFHQLPARFPDSPPPPLPRITDWYLHGCGWALLLPVAFCAAAFWLCRPSTFTFERFAAYSGFSIVTITCLGAFATMAMVSPYLDFGYPFWPR